MLARDTQGFCQDEESRYMPDLDIYLRSWIDLPRFLMPDLLYVYTPVSVSVAVGVGDLLHSKCCVTPNIYVVDIGNRLYNGSCFFSR